MSAQFRISDEDRIDLASTSYRLHSQDADGTVLRQIGDPSISLSYKLDEFRNLLDEGGARLHRRALAADVAKARLRMREEYLSVLPEKTRLKVLWQEQICLTFLRFENDERVTRSAASMAKMLPLIYTEVCAFTYSGRYCGRKPNSNDVIKTYPQPSRTTVLRWLRTYTDNGCELISLLPKKRDTGKGQRKLAVEIEKLITKLLSEFLKDQRFKPGQMWPKVNDSVRKLNEERAQADLPPLAPPCKDTILNRIRALDPFSTYASRHSLSAAKKRFCQYETGLETLEPLERVEIDEWCIDLITIFEASGIFEHMSIEQLASLNRGRRWLYLAIDCATRCVVGMRLATTANAKDAIRTVEDITRDKSYLALAAGCESKWDQHGAIVEIVCDQGGAFRSEEFRIAVRDLETTLTFPPGGLPHLRASVERIFGTLSVSLTALLTGRTFSNPKERGDYDAKARAALTDDDLIRALILYVVDVYHNRPHGGLMGETPANCWRRLCKDTPPYASPDLPTRIAVFGEEVRRKVRGNGVHVLGVPYVCDPLRMLHMHSRQRSVRVRIDTEDLGHVSVCINDEWHIAKPLVPNLKGISVMRWRSAIADVRARNLTASKFSEATITRALSKISQLNADAMRLMRLTPTKVTAEAIERAEQQLLAHLTIDHDVAVNNSETDNWLSGGMKTGRSPFSSAAHEKLEEDVVSRTGPDRPQISFEED